MVNYSSQKYHHSHLQIKALNPIAQVVSDIAGLEIHTLQVHALKHYIMQNYGASYKIPPSPFAE